VSNGKRFLLEDVEDGLAQVSSVESLEKVKGSIYKRAICAAFTSVRFVQHLQACDLCSIYKRAICATFTSVQFGQHLQACDLCSIYKRAIWAAFTRGFENT
jgi:hypothetical protein